MNTERAIRDSLNRLADRTEDAPDLAARARAGVRRRRRNRSLAIVAAVLVLTATAGLVRQTLGRPDGPASPSTPRSGPPCLGKRFDATDPQHAGALLPADAVVVEAMWCKAAYRGTTYVTAEFRATTGLEPLLQVLRRPDTGGICAGVGHGYHWQLWVRVTDGRWLEPRWPLTPCGPTPEVVAVLDQVPFHLVAQAPYPPDPPTPVARSYPWRRDS